MRPCPRCMRAHEDHYKHCLDCGSRLSPARWYHALLKAVALMGLLGLLGGLGYAGIRSWKARVTSTSDVVLNDQDPSGLSGYGIPAWTPDSPAHPGAAEPHAPSQSTSEPATAKPTERQKTTSTWAEATEVVFHPEGQNTKDAAPVPAQRRRLVRTNSGSSVTMEDVLAKEDVIHNPVGYYSHAVTEEIMRWYNSLTRKDFDPPSIGSRCRIQLRVDTQTDKFEILKVEGTFNERGRAMLAAAVERASGRVAVPKAIKDLGLRYEEIEFEMVVKPNPNN